jgi:protein-disulfide isomerase
MDFIKNYAVTLLLSVIVAALTSGVFLAFYPSNNSDLDSSIRDFLLKNPEIISQMQENYDAKLAAELAANQKRNLEEKAGIIFDSKYQVEIGNKDATIKIVEFFDYNCPYCQRAMYDMEKIIENNPDVKFVIKEWPVLGSNSIDAHNVSVAFSKLMPEKYHEFHLNLLGLKGKKGKQIAIEIALSLGVDENVLLKEMAKPYIRETFSENNLIANELGITGTPSYIIGDEVIFGAVGFDQLSSRIAKLNK